MTMNEAETRAEKIDPALKSASWGEVERSRIQWEYAIVPGRIEGQGRRGRTEIADDLRIHRNRKLAYVAYRIQTVSRESRADQAKRQLEGQITDTQAGFLDFVLNQYVRMGVDELSTQNLSPLLKLKCATRWRTPSRIWASRTKS